MLFNSFEFIFVFLPVTLAGFFLLGRVGRHDLHLWFLSLASMLFYAWWYPPYVLLILAEILFSFYIGRLLSSPMLNARQRGLLVSAAIAVVLLVLGYFKYAHFFLGIAHELTGWQWALVVLPLPLGISFHTFQQIAYLVDAYRGRAPRYRLAEFCLFVTFFPQLIAGPIVHHHEAIPQLRRQSIVNPRMINLLVGVALFACGLFKKTIIADSLATLATPIFDAAADGTKMSLQYAWLGALSYTLQLYFDFSAYSDMAAGLARLFNIRLPMNFYSPYRATSIADFWRRWHITLSRFLRDYLYIPLGGNRRGLWRQMINLLATMLLGGLWHGAGWTFIIWGGLHGLSLVIHRLWQQMRLGSPRLRPLPGPAGWLLTMLFVVVAWVFFRAANISAAFHLLGNMVGLHVKHASFQLASAFPLHGWSLIIVTGLLAVAAPNLHQIFRRYAPTIALLPVRRWRASGLVGRLEWRPTPVWALVVTAAFVSALLGMLGWHSEFLYFQF